MPVFLTSPASADSIVHHLVKEILRPDLGYLGTLLIAQFYTGLVPDEVQEQYEVYGSIYDSSPRTVLTYVSPQDQTKPDENEGIYTQTVQVSVWSANKNKTASAAQELRKLLNYYPVPVEYANLIVTNLRAVDAMTMQEEDRTWQSIFDVTLTLEE